MAHLVGFTNYEGENICLVSSEIESIRRKDTSRPTSTPTVIITKSGREYEVRDSFSTVCFRLERLLPEDK